MTVCALTKCQRRALVGLHVRPQPAAGEAAGHEGEVVLERIGVEDQRWGGQCRNLHRWRRYTPGGRSDRPERDGALVSYCARMKFGLMFANAGPGADPEFSIALAQLAEELGFESLWTVEHVVVPKGHESSYPYSKDGRMPGGEAVAIPDPLIWLTWVAAATRTINLATGIVILPQRNPVILAKECATLDRLSKGRLLLGIGVGWLREEFDALGVPWDERGARTDEYVGALRELWSSSEPTFAGRFANFDSAISEPKPFGGRAIPIHVGGHSMAAAARAGRLGDGFFPGTARELPALLSTMRASAVEHGRDPDAIEVTSGGVPSLDGVKAAQELGVSRFIVSPMGADLDTIRTKLGAFSEQVISASL